jgi:hypothetical protein
VGVRERPGTAGARRFSHACGEKRCYHCKTPIPTECVKITPPEEAEIARHVVDVLVSSPLCRRIPGGVAVAEGIDATYLGLDD